MNQDDFFKDHLDLMEQMRTRHEKMRKQYKRRERYAIVFACAWIGFVICCLVGLAWIVYQVAT